MLASVKTSRKHPQAQVADEVIQRKNRALRVERRKRRRGEAGSLHSDIKMIRHHGRWPGSLARVSGPGSVLAIFLFCCLSLAPDKLIVGASTSITTRLKSSESETRRAHGAQAETHLHHNDRHHHQHNTNSSDPETQMNRFKRRVSSSKQAAGAKQPEFSAPMGNVSAVLGRDVRLVCTVENLGKHQVSYSWRAVPCGLWILMTSGRMISLATH